MERISGGGQASAPPPSSAPPGQPAQPTVLLPGTTIDVQVLRALSAGRFLLALGDREFVASSSAPLQPGSQVRLNVAAADGDGVVLRLDEPVRAEVSAAPERLAALRLPATPAAAAVLAAFEEAGAPLDPVRLQAALRATAEPQAPATTAQAHALLARSGLPATPALVQVAMRAAEVRLPDVAAATRRSSQPVALPDADQGAPAIMRAFALAGVRPLPTGRVAQAPVPTTADRPAPATARWGFPSAPASVVTTGEAEPVAVERIATASREARIEVRSSGTYATSALGPSQTSQSPSALTRNPAQQHTVAAPPAAFTMGPQSMMMPGSAPPDPGRPAASSAAPPVADPATADPPIEMRPLTRNAESTSQLLSTAAPRRSDQEAPVREPIATVKPTVKPTVATVIRPLVTADAPEPSSAPRPWAVSRPTPSVPAAAGAMPTAPAHITVLASGTTNPPTGEHVVAATTTNAPGASDQRSAASSQQPAASDQQPATSGRQPAASGQQPATNSQQPATNSQQPAASGQRPAASGQQPATNSQRPAASIPLPPTLDDIPVPTLVRQIVTRALAGAILPDLRQSTVERQVAPNVLNAQPAAVPDPPARHAAAPLPPAPLSTEHAATTQAQLAPAAVAADDGTSQTVREHLAEQVFKAKDLADYDRVVPLPLATTQTTTPARLAVATRSTGNGAQATFVRVDADMSRLGPVSLRLSGTDAGGPLAITLVAGPAAGALLAGQLPALIEDLRRIGVDAAVRVVSDG